jgi:hypothetical protein
MATHLWIKGTKKEQRSSKTLSLRSYILYTARKMARRDPTSRVRPRQASFQKEYYEYDR